jgi:hypothetical protein
MVLSSRHLFQFLLKQARLALLGLKMCLPGKSILRVCFEFPLPFGEKLATDTQFPGYSTVQLVA